MPEPRVLIALLGAAGVLWALKAVFENFIRGGGASFDTRILFMFRSASDPADPLGPEWVERVARDLTSLGSFAVLTLVITTSVLFLFMARQARTARMVLAAIAGGGALTASLKALFGRARPDPLLHEVVVTSASFPSGHTVMAAVTFLTLGALVARTLPGRQLKAYVMSVSVIVTLLVGISRIYLGVHWPSDVLAGWSLGAAWSLFCWRVAGWMERREMKY